MNNNTLSIFISDPVWWQYLIIKAITYINMLNYHHPVWVFVENLENEGMAVIIKTISDRKFNVAIEDLLIW